MKICGCEIYANGIRVSFFDDSAQSAIKDSCECDSIDELNNICNGFDRLVITASKTYYDEAQYIFSIWKENENNNIREIATFVSPLEILKATCQDDIMNKTVIFVGPLGTCYLLPNQDEYNEEFNPDQDYESVYELVVQLSYENTCLVFDSCNYLGPTFDIPNVIIADRYYLSDACSKYTQTLTDNNGILDFGICKETLIYYDQNGLTYVPIIGTKSFTELNSIDKICSCSDHIAILSKEGSVHCCGKDDYNQCDVDISDVKDVAVGDGYTCVLCEDGTVRVYGVFINTGCIGVLEQKNIKRLFGGRDYIISLDSDNTITVWGDKKFSQKINGEVVSAYLFENTLLVLISEGSVLSYSITDNLPTEDFPEWKDIIVLCSNGEYVVGFGNNGGKSYGDFSSDLAPELSVTKAVVDDKGVFVLDNGRIRFIARDSETNPPLIADILPIEDAND